MFIHYVDYPLQEPFTGVSHIAFHFQVLNTHYGGEVLIFEPGTQQFRLVDAPFSEFKEITDVIRMVGEDIKKGGIGRVVETCILESALPTWYYK